MCFALQHFEAQKQSSKQASSNSNPVYQAINAQSQAADRQVTLLLLHRDKREHALMSNYSV